MHKGRGHGKNTRGRIRNSLNVNTPTTAMNINGIVKTFPKEMYDRGCQRLNQKFVREYVFDAGLLGQQEHVKRLRQAISIMHGTDITEGNKFTFKGEEYSSVAQLVNHYIHEPTENILMTYKRCCDKCHRNIQNKNSTVCTYCRDYNGFMFNPMLIYTYTPGGRGERTMQMSYNNTLFHKSEPIELYDEHYGRGNVCNSLRLLPATGCHFSRCAARLAKLWSYSALIPQVTVKNTDMTHSLDSSAFDRGCDNRYYDIYLHSSLDKFADEGTINVLYDCARPHDDSKWSEGSIGGHVRVDCVKPGASLVARESLILAYEILKQTSETEDTNWQFRLDFAKGALDCLGIGLEYGQSIERKSLITYEQQPPNRGIIYLDNISYSMIDANVTVDEAITSCLALHTVIDEIHSSMPMGTDDKDVIDDYMLNAIFDNNLLLNMFKTNWMLISNKGKHGLLSRSQMLATLSKKKNFGHDIDHSNARIWDRLFDLDSLRTDSVLDMILNAKE